MAHNPAPTTLGSLPYALFLGILFFAPLAFGSVETWSIASLEIVIAIAALSYLVLILRKDLIFYQVPGLIPLLLLLLWMALQLLPLPAELVRTIAPAIYRAYEPILELVTNDGQWIPLTVNHKAGLLELLRITSYGLFYILTVQLLSQKERLTQTVRSVAWLAMAIAFLAILQKFTSPHKIYWFRPTAENAGTVGPWVYHNHYAGFMELVFPLVLALFFYYRPKIASKLPLRGRIVSLFSERGSHFYFFLGFGSILILASVFIALSRGGTIAIILGLVFFLTLQRWKHKGQQEAAPLLILGCVLLVVTWFGWDPILGKFNKTLTESGSISDGRLLLWQDCLPLIRDFLVTGSGFGTFINTFPQYNTIPSSAILDHAHNDYIELLSDGGLVGFSLAASFVLCIVRHGFKQLRIRSDPYSLLLVMAGLTALFSILIHSFTDFNMHNGANGLYFFFLCGILISAGNTRLHYRRRPTLLPPARYQVISLALLAIPLLLVSISTQGGILKGRSLYRKTTEIYLNPQLSAQTLEKLLATINKAIAADPMEGRYSYYKGKLLGYAGDGKGALSNYIAASRKDPLEGAYLQRIGMLLDRNNQDSATILIEEGYRRSKNKTELLFGWAEWLIRQGRLTEAKDALQLGLQRFPMLSQKLPLLLLSSTLSRDEITAILPHRAEAWIKMASFSEKLGQKDDKAYYLRHALDFIDQEPDLKPRYFGRIYWFYMQQKQIPEAMAVLRSGIQHLPGTASLHILLGDAYRRQQIPYRAREEYQEALLLDPGNDKITRRLKKLEGH